MTHSTRGMMQEKRKGKQGGKPADARQTSGRETDEDMRTRGGKGSNRGKLAVVTGASTGIGYELAKLCAGSGFDLVVAADEPKIHQAAKDLESFGVKVKAVEADLSTRAGVDEFLRAINSRPVDALLANAGIGLGGAFISQGFEAIQHVIDTNVTGTLHLVHETARAMNSRGHGRILFTGSIAGFTPGTFNAVYNASKAFIDSFSAALRNELKDSGVTVTCLMPGATETEFFQRAGMADTKIGASEKDDPADVAEVGFKAMMNGEGDVVAGWKNKIQSTIALITPSDVLAEQHRKRAEPGSGSKKQKSMTEASSFAADEKTRKDGGAGLFTAVTKHPFLTGGLLLVGAGLAYAIATNISSEASGEVARELHLETSIAIDKSPAEIFAFWRDFKNLPLFMENLESVSKLEDGNTHWVALGPGGVRVEWDAEIYNEKENELISWRSLESAGVVHAGSVRFQPGPAGHGTYVRVSMNYNPPVGKVVGKITEVLGGSPLPLIKSDLRRLKQLMETGEIATVAGQSSGRSEEAEPITEQRPAAMAQGGS